MAFQFALGNGGKDILNLPSTFFIGFPRKTKVGSIHNPINIPRFTENKMNF